MSGSSRVAKKLSPKRTALNLCNYYWQLTSTMVGLVCASYHTEPKLTMKCIADSDYTTLWCCREGDVWHAGVVEASGCVGKPAGLGAIPTGISTGGAVRIARHLPSIQQDTVSVEPAFHLLRAAEWRVAADKLGRLRRDDRARRQHVTCWPRSSRRQNVGSTRRRRTPPLSRLQICRLYVLTG